MTKTDSNAWLEYLYQHKDITPRAANKDFMRMVIEIQEKDDLSLIDDILKNAEPAKLSKYAITGLLRSTAVYKDYLPNWKIFLKKVDVYLEAQDKSNTTLLVGLRSYLTE